MTRGNKLGLGNCTQAIRRWIGLIALTAAISTVCFGLGPEGAIANGAESYGYDPTSAAVAVSDDPNAGRMCVDPVDPTNTCSDAIEAGSTPHASLSVIRQDSSRDRAAKAAHDVPIGPVAEKAHRIADRVLEKGAPFPGYKGGRNFENNGKGMLLPKSNANGSFTYREWDVNPYTKGVNRGSERLVTGSDGSAYYTTNHYETFTRFR